MDRCTQKTNPARQETASRTEADMPAWRDPVGPRFKSEATLWRTGGIILFLFICKDASLTPSGLLSWYFWTEAHAFGPMFSLFDHIWEKRTQDVQTFVEISCQTLQITLMKGRRDLVQCASNQKGSARFSDYHRIVAGAVVDVDVALQSFLLSKEKWWHMNTFRLQRQNLAMSARVQHLAVDHAHKNIAKTAHCTFNLWI